MWPTPDGERTLQGAEAALFKEGLGTLVDMVRDDTEGLWHFGIPPFDNLPPNQKLAVLAQIGNALLCKDQPVPRLTAVWEAAVGAVFEAIRVMVEMEIDQPAEWQLSPTWRARVLSAARERQIEELLDPTSGDLDGWEVLIDSLKGDILWDEDWRYAELHLDAPPDQGQAVKTLLGIDDNYYVAVPPDPSEEELQGILAILKKLTRAV